MTGATGFIGRHLVARLSQRGVGVRVLRRRAGTPFDEAVDTVDGELADPDALRRLVTGADAVVHLAGAVAAPDAATFAAVNTEGTAQVGAAAQAAGVPRLLYVSSLAAREPQLSAYAASKRAGEDRLEQTRDLAWDALRPPAVYGPGDIQVLSFLRLLKRRIGLLPSDGRVALIHVDDLVAAVDAWLQGPPPAGHRFELADSRPDGYLWREIVDAAAQELSVAPIHIRPPTAGLRLAARLVQGWGLATGAAPFLTPDKIRELCHPDWSAAPQAFVAATGWQPRVDLPTGLRRSIGWYRERGWL